MAEEQDKSVSGRLKTSYFSTVISISLVLFLLGLLGLVMLNARVISDYVKENIGFTVFLKSDVKEADILRIQKLLDAENFVKETSFVDPDEAAKVLKKELGEDFTEFLGYNPLSASIDVYLNAAYANTDSLMMIEAKLLENPAVQEVSYHKDLVAFINSNVKKIGIVLLGFTILLMVISIALINNTIRLAIYSKRFLIKTMQLVGATSWFIRRPFEWRGVINGFISALLANILLMGVIYLTIQNIPDLQQLHQLELILILFAAVTLLGVIISWISTSLAVRKFLRVETGRLY